MRMAVRIMTLIVTGGLAQLLPSMIMKRKNKTDTAGKGSILAARLFAEASLIAAEVFLVRTETDLLSFLILSLILMLSAVIIIIDTRCRIIPNLCLFPMLLLCAGYLARRIALGESWTRIPSGIVSMIIMCALLMSLTSVLHFQGSLGAGDIKFLSVAAFLFTLSSRMTGLLIGLVISMAAYLIPMLLMKKITMKSMIAFGPFIGFGLMGGICWLYL